MFATYLAIELNMLRRISQSIVHNHAFYRSGVKPLAATAACGPEGINSSRCQRQGNVQRCFTRSASLRKKGNKAARAEQQPNASVSSADANDPFDFTTLQSEIDTGIENLKNDLSKLRAGGRFNPEVLETIRVQPDKGSNETAKLNDLAQVIPKGRTVQILVGEMDVGNLVPDLQRGLLTVI